MSPEIQLHRFIVPKMIEHGYSKEQIEKYCSAWDGMESSHFDLYSEDDGNNVVVHSDLADFSF